MDEIEHFPLTRIPMQSLTLRLARSPIRMRHGASWKIDKLNPVHDLVICLTGGGSYMIGDDPVDISPGEALLIPAYTRFRGRHNGGEELYTGIAQHFSLELFKTGDIINQLSLRNKVRLSNWDALRPFIELYSENSPRTATTLPQHHQFMVLLLAYLQDAFIGWDEAPDTPKPQDQLSRQIMLVAARLSSDPLGAGVDETLADIPYNLDYFRRAFRDRIGLTPQKFRELKRMEFAIHRLDSGLTVKQVAIELGYSDPYFFSRQFKRHIGASPSRYRARNAMDMDAD
ncbi:helix-turn-helix domain-containing protein [Actibacterium lipolyticum]|uniref:DNA-binding transcriptional regulator AraC n=1 Tax=Actibacterium lipolyticum TaxID=1524263 RepID=A0A238KTD4_9RHOB|nr:helix-turn-helix domain-containing protein [Actibacterium lipolyticum]SMX45988.1 DNA-binding transcriptional regulator AraC [Actibacterium lipolyticum]